MEISTKRFKELEKAERILNALEAGGVDNWDGYRESLKDILAEEEKEEIISVAVNDICESICGNIDQPAGAGCGYGVTRNGMDGIEYILKRVIKEIKEIGEEN